MTAGGSGEDDKPSEAQNPQPRVEPLPPAVPVGSIRMQQPGEVRLRKETVAEARARDKARKRKAELEAQAAAAAAKRRRRMKGAIAIAGVAALVGGGYLAYSAVTHRQERIQAYCVQERDGKQIVVSDSYCAGGNDITRCVTMKNGVETPVPDDWCDTRNSTHHSVGYLPSSFYHYSGGRQYRYHYGGTGIIGKPPRGGTTVRPKKATITTKSGTVIQRGGFGSKSSSSRSHGSGGS